MGFEGNWEAGGCLHQACLSWRITTAQDKFCKVQLCCFIYTQVRCWEVQDNGQTVPKAQQMHTGPVLDVCWSDVSLIMQSSFEPWSRCCLLGHRIIYDVPFSLTRMGVKCSLLPVTRQPRCGILTAIKQCRLHRLDESPQINCVAKRMKLTPLRPLMIYFHSMMVRSKQSTG